MAAAKTVAMRSVSPPAPRRPRRWLAGTASLAVGAIVAAGVYFFGSSPSVLGPEGILEAVRVFQDREIPEPGYSLAEHVLPDGFPLGSSVVHGAATHWRPVSDFLGRSGVAYDLNIGGVRGTLYVVQLDRPRGSPKVIDAPAHASPTPTKTTGGRAMAVWTQSNLLYVMVVQGGVREYRSLVAQPGGLARTFPRPPRFSAAAPPAA